MRCTASPRRGTRASTEVIGIQRRDAHRRGKSEQTLEISPGLAESVQQRSDQVSRDLTGRGGRGIGSGQIDEGMGMTVDGDVQQLDEGLRSSVHDIEAQS